MNKQGHLASWDMMRMRHGITLRVIDQLSDAQLTSHPIAGMKTPIELIVHMYSSTDQIANAVLTGTFGASTEKETAAAITTKAQLLEFMAKTWTAANAKAQQLTDAQLGAIIATPWGSSFPGFVMISFIHDEYLHHRGQLYAYARVFGIEPVMLWDLEHNAPEFAKQAEAKA